MNYKKAKIDDMPAIMALVNDAVKNLQKHGNMQWDERYPLDIDFIPEIEAGTPKNRILMDYSYAINPD